MNVRFDPATAAPRAVTEDGPFHGWTTWDDTDPWEAHGGPFYYRRMEDGRMRAAFIAERKHMNAWGMIHGGALLTFADFALFALATPALGSDAGVTVTLNGEFVASGKEGERVEAGGEIVKAGASLVFVRGTLEVGTRALLAFSGVIKRLPPRQ